MEFTELSLQELISLFLKRIWIIIICTVLGMIGAYVISSYVLPSEYTSSVSLYVNADGDSNNASANLSELNYAQKIVNTYIEILKTNVFLTEVSDTVNLDYTLDKLRDMININAVNNTEIFNVKVKTNDPQHCYVIASVIAEKAPNKILQIKEADSVKVVDPAIFPEKPSGPNVMLNTVIGTVMGFIVSLLIVFGIEIFDVRIKDEDDISKNYNIPLLGCVPNFSPSKKEGC